MRFLAFCLFLFLCSAALCAQRSHTIRGNVVDETGAPLPFVNLFLLTSKTGTITNNNGAFSLTFSGNAETLSISFIGYETQKIEVSRGIESLSIKLKPSSTQLNEHTVTGLSAEALLKKTIEKIPDNYPTEPFLLKVYVRHKALKENELFYMQEVALDIVKSYQSSFSDEYFLVKNRNFRFVPSREILMGAGGHDVVKTASNFFNARFFRDHNVRYLLNSTFDNRSVYVLEFSSKNKGDNRGKIYIDEEDLAFVRFEMVRGNYNVKTQYKKIENKYFWMFSNAVYLNKLFSRVIPVETDLLVMDIVPSFSRDDIEGTHIGAGDILAVYATQEHDTLFWQEHNAVLPDSTILEALERYHTAQKDSVSNSVVRDSSQYQAYLKRLYRPNISLVVSSDLANDISTLYYNTNSINRYAINLMSRKIRKPIPMLLGVMAYSYLSPPFGHVAAEWLLLNKNGIQANMNPTVFNRYWTSYLYNVDNTVLSDFKNDNYLDFMRLHTVRREGIYAKSFLIEEELAKVDLSNKNNKSSYQLLYYTELLWYRLMSFSEPFGRSDIKPSDKPESRQPIIVDRGRSWVKYLFDPEMAYQRHVREDDLTDEEQKYFKRAGFWSLLNLASPQMFSISKFPLGKRNSFTFSVNYLPVPFGELFGQNIWLMHNHNQLHGVFIKQYRNYEKTTFGMGYKLYDIHLFNNIFVTTSVDYWQQPNDFDFRATSSFSGFRVGQTFEYKLLKKQFSEQDKLSLLLGYDYKSKGYIPESFFLEENFKVDVGFRWYFR